MVREKGVELLDVIKVQTDNGSRKQKGIDVRGTCKGMVHAGAYGDITAVVVADRLMPTQIRIADRIAQSPEKMEKPTVAERASIKDGKIVIEPIERQEIRA